jgi:predicted nucleic acid-binding protein
VTRAARSLGADASAALAEGDVVLLRSDVLAAAAELEPTALRTLDAIHLATALSLGGAFDAFVAYDERLLEAAHAYGLGTASPGTTARRRSRRRSHGSRHARRENRRPMRF